MDDLTPTHETLVTEVRQMIADARTRAASAVNAELTWLYWQVGRRIHREILGSQRASYGEEIVSALSARLASEHGRGFSARNLRHMVRFAQTFPDERIVHTLCAELSWSHLRHIAALDDSLKREFYVELCRLEGWSVRQLHERMQSLLYEAVEFAENPEPRCPCVLLLDTSASMAVDPLAVPARAYDIGYYRPGIFMVTDGQPS